MHEVEKKVHEVVNKHVEVGNQGLRGEIKAPKLR